MSVGGTPVSAITEAQKNAIIDHCDAIREDLKTVQKKDRRVRVYLGRYYETILSKFITPLNIRIVGNSLPVNERLFNNQVNFADKKSAFEEDYISYQQELEKLVTGINCKNMPEEFYLQLGRVQRKRKIVNQDATELRKLMGEQVKLVTALKGKL